MKGYPEYYTIIYRNGQRIVILNENPEKREAPPKRGKAKVYQTKERLPPFNRDDRFTLSQNRNLSKFWRPK